MILFKNHKNFEIFDQKSRENSKKIDSILGNERKTADFSAGFT